MLNAVVALPNVTVNRGARVVGIDQSDCSYVAVEVANGGNTKSYRCRMLIAADGTPSRLARLAGIGVHNRRIATLMGFRVSTENLRERDFGHLFLGVDTPILVYPIGNGQARILFDIPYRPDRRPTAADCISMAEALPSGLRREVMQAIAMQPRMSSLTVVITAERVAHGRVVLVGDAGGSCHPLTASGMTMCVSDALLLRKSLIERSSDLSAALQLYQRRRRWPQTTRLALAHALREALCGESSTLRVVRSGIFAHWRNSGAARSATLALLSTADGRPSALLRQITAVLVRGFIEHLRNPVAANQRIGAPRMAAALIAYLLRHIRQVLISSPVSMQEHDPVGAPSDQPATNTLSPSARKIAR
jgi:2-polyprenyl-6-methoxyphenol hydroxylase-like FAD-dependent oxidoreductase